NSTDEHGTTSLMMAAASGNPEAVATLIQAGADVNTREGVHGQTALMFAAALGRAAAVRVLAKNGADPSVTSKAAKAPKVASLFEQNQTRPAEKAPEKPTNDKAQLDAFATSLGFKSAEFKTGNSELAQMQATLQKLAAKVDE